MECFDKVKKMADKVKMIEKHLEIVSQAHQKNERPGRKDHRTR